MWLVSLAVSVARAQSFELTADDVGTTVPLLEAGTSYVVDVSDPSLALDAMNLLTPDGETTLAEIYDGARLDGAEVGDVMGLSLGDRGEVLLSFGTGHPPGRHCQPLYELQCVFWWGHWVCQWVDVGLTCCADGTTACGDYILGGG